MEEEEEEGSEKEGRKEDGKRIIVELYFKHGPQITLLSEQLMRMFYVFADCGEKSICELKLFI